MKTFIVLIPVSDSVVEPRKACEMIENTKFNIEQPTALKVLDKIIFVIINNLSRCMH